MDGKILLRFNGNSSHHFMMNKKVNFIFLKVWCQGMFDTFCIDDVSALRVFVERMDSQKVRLLV